MSFVSSWWLAIHTSLPGSRNGSGLSKIVFTTLKIVQLAPTPSPTIKIANAANPASRKSVRTAYRTSRRKFSKNGVPPFPFLDTTDLQRSSRTSVDDAIRKRFRCLSNFVVEGLAPPFGSSRLYSPAHSPLLLQHAPVTSPATTPPLSPITKNWQPS